MRDLCNIMLWAVARKVCGSPPRDPDISILTILLSVPPPSFDL